jgi:hypothetical protein
MKRKQDKFMEFSPSWEAASHSATTEFPNFYGTQSFITVYTKELGPYPERRNEERNSVNSVRERTIPPERPSVVIEISANFCG